MSIAGTQSRRACKKRDEANFMPTGLVKEQERLQRGRIVIPSSDNDCSWNKSFHRCSLVFQPGHSARGKPGAILASSFAQRDSSAIKHIAEIICQSAHFGQKSSGRADS
jgi:hypothetical protein